LTPVGPAAELLGKIASEHVLVTSPYLLAELLEVLRRPKIRALHGLDERGIRRIISRVFKLSAMITLPRVMPAIVPTDPKDNPIVMTVLSGRADVLCTLDRHIHEPAVVNFCSFHGVRVMKDLALLAELRAN
jgi:putative PIN family toxin of toxin-antitoxin system